MGVFYDHILIDLCPGLHGFLERHETLREIAKVLAAVALLLLIALGYASYLTFDNAGWIPHSHDTPVWVAGDWIVGEYRDCGMRTTTTPVGVTMLQTERAELPRLFCGKNWKGLGEDEFEIAMPDPASATNTLWGRGAWSA